VITVRVTYGFGLERMVQRGPATCVGNNARPFCVVLLSPFRTGEDGAKGTCVGNNARPFCVVLSSPFHTFDYMWDLGPAIITLKVYTLEVLLYRIAHYCV